MAYSRSGSTPTRGTRPSLPAFFASAFARSSASVPGGVATRPRTNSREPDGDGPRANAPYRDQSGYSSLRQARGSTDWGLGVRSSRNELYGATNRSGARTV